jgi:hypothetical protein
LDFITNYIKFLAEKRKSLDAAVVRLEGGLTTLEKAAEDTKTLSEELAIKNADIAEKKVVVEELIADITEKSTVATKSAKIASEKKEFLLCSLLRSMQRRKKLIEKWKPQSQR